MTWLWRAALKRRSRLVLILVAGLGIAFALSGSSDAQDGATASLEAPVAGDSASGEPPADVRLFNEYIAITVNASEGNTGRFSVQTTGGDPDRPTDDESLLIYKVPGQSPWTSYATLRIDGIDYVFGGEPTERAGRAGLFGEETTAPHVVDDNRIETAFSVGPLTVLQSLSIIRSTTTGLLDTVRIEYRVTNESQTAKSVGFRLMLDTMLGENDGAPYRVGELAITSDTAFEGEQIPHFWQAFDSLSDPKVTAQGTLQGTGGALPDRVAFTNWGAVADGLWDFDFQPGRDFTRLGEFELDSATALYWNPKNLGPGDTRTYVTHYGLGGISISPGDLSIGVTSPATVTAVPGEEVTFPVVAYIQNTGEGEARDVVAAIRLPNGLKGAAGERLTRNLGHLPSGRTAQVTWRIALDRAVGGELNYTVRVAAINAEANEVSRSVRVVSPAALSMSLQDKNGRLRIVNDRWEPLPYRIAATIQNTGGSDAHDVRVRWESPIGLELAAGDQAEKPIGPLFAGDEAQLTWHIRPQTVSNNQPYPFIGNLAYSLKATMAGVTEEFRTDGYLDVPPLASQVKVEVVQEAGDAPIRVGDFFLVRVKTQNVRSFYGADIMLHYDPGALQLVAGPLGVDRGRVFLEPAGEDMPGDHTFLSWRQPAVQIDAENGTATVRFGGERSGAERPTLFWVSDSIATLRFRAQRAGTHDLTLRPARIYDQDNQGVKAEPVHGKVAVVE